MIQTRSRLQAFVALMLTLAFVVVAGTSSAVLAQDEGAAEAEAATEETEASEATPEPTPEPTPYPEFEPSTVTLRLDRFADGFDAPVYIADDGLAGKACRYVVERGGLVHVIRSDGTTRVGPYLDISNLVENAGPEQGLHSIAFHPGFKKNKRFFVHYTTADKQNVVAEFRGTPCGKATKNKRVKTWLNESQDFINNNGGWIGFGPDNLLYVTTGDGGGRSPGDPNGLGQTPPTRLGKVLRLDVGRPDGIAKFNPYVKQVNKKLKARGGFARETWAYGLRDPRRASFDRETGDLWIGDVGQDRFEEINLIPKGATKKGDAFNFGWSDVVGADTCHNLPDCDPTLYDPPVHYYDKVTPNRGVTGGYVYRGERPELEELVGVYLFSDVASGYIWGLDADAIREGHEVPAHLLLDAPSGIVSFGEDDSGELYVVSLDGTIYRLDLL